MIKRNIKMKVTPEESKQVQEICFANGIGWWNNCRKVEYAEMPYLIIGERLFFKDREQFIEYKACSYEEVDADLFIRTYGSCVEETAETIKQQTPTSDLKDTPQQKSYMCFVKGVSTPKKIHNTLEEAEKEARRLCEKELVEVTLLEVVKKFGAKVLVEEIY